MTSAPTTRNRMGLLASLRRRFRRLGWLLPGLLWCAGSLSAAVPLLDTYYSPRNKERPLRKETRYIILHTTEGPSRGSGRKLAERGEAHYMIDESGRIYRVIDHRRVAYHCGRSMWEGRKNLDTCSIGIEMVGYHNRDATPAQYKALRELLVELRHIYRVPDRRVLTHSMVAYGVPNRWHRRSHRGRKRCAMRFALVDVRARIGLRDKPFSDPDVKAGRLAVGDPNLQRLLYSGSAAEQARAVAMYDQTETNVIGPGRSAWDVARDAYNRPETVYIFPNGTRRQGNQIGNWRAIPPGTRVLISGGDDNVPEPVRMLGRDGATPGALAGAETDSATTFYIFPDGKCRSGDDLSAADFKCMPKGTRVLVGYRKDGPITARRRAFDICGTGWRAPDTYYLFPNGKLVSGSEIDPGRIPAKTMVLFKN